MTYQQLKAGDVRQKDDEMRPVHSTSSNYTMGRMSNAGTHWRPDPLIGHPILLADLIHLEFRRPIK